MKKLALGFLTFLMSSFSVAQTISSLSPTSGITAGGTTVVISCSAAATAASNVYFGGSQGTILGNSNSAVTVTAPAGSGVVPCYLVVGVNNTNSLNFTYVLATPTNTPTATITNTATNTCTPTLTGTPTNTATNTPTSTATNTVTNTPTFTATNTVTNTTTNTATNTPTNTATVSYNGASRLWPQATQVNAEIGNNKFWQLSMSTTLCTDINGNTCTFTPTGSPTPTATNTPTPFGIQVKSFDVLATGGVTFMVPNGRVASGWACECAGSIANNSAVSLQAYPIVGNALQGANGQSNTAQNVTNVAFAYVTNQVSGILNPVSNGLLVVPVHATVTQTQVWTCTYLAFTNVSAIPVKFRHLFKRSLLFHEDDPYAEGHGYSVFYDSTGKPVKVHSWG